MLNKDTLWVGGLIGILVPATIYTIFSLGMEMAGVYITLEIREKMQLLLFGVNAVLMRQFMVKRHQDNIGRGILFVTFLGVIAHVLYYYTELFY